jgi:phosphomannomutase
MTPEVAARFAMVAGEVFAEQHRARPNVRPGRPLVILGRDGRVGGELLAAAASAGLASVGCDVLDLGVAMTPTIAVVVDARDAAGGLVLTASHNPQNWNGLKPILRDATGVNPALGVVSASAPPKSFADQIIARYRTAERSGAQGAGYDELGAVSRGATGAPLGLPSEGVFTHVGKVRDALQTIGIVQDRSWSALRCVVDSVNASGREGSKHFLGQTLAHHLGDSDSGIFPHTPEPTRENLTRLCSFVKDKRADVGFAQDPDADRLALINENGSYIGEEYTIVLCAQMLLGSAGDAAKGSTICVNLSTSRMIEDVAAGYGARVVRTAVGEANVVEAMKREKAIFGGEGNGGVIWPRVTYIRDSLSGMGLVMGLLAKTGKTISQLVADVPAYSIVKQKVDLTDMSQATRSAEAVRRAFKSERIDTQDGVRVDFDSQRAWLHVRGSNTEPIMRLIAEAPNETIAHQIIASAKDAINKG